MSNGRMAAGSGGGGGNSCRVSAGRWEAVQTAPFSPASHQAASRWEQSTQRAGWLLGSRSEACCHCRLVAEVAITFFGLFMPAD